LLVRVLQLPLSLALISGARSESRPKCHRQFVRYLAKKYTHFSPANLILFAYIMVAGIVSLALLIELCFRRGTKGPNRYGPDPLAKA
jgi:hypothetical protein